LLRKTENTELRRTAVCTVFQLMTQTQELDGGTIDNLGPKQTKVTQIDKMK